MSVLLSIEDCLVICHEQFLNELYSSVDDNGSKFDYKVREEIFGVLQPYKSKKERHVYKTREITLITERLSKIKDELMFVLKNRLGKLSVEASKKDIDQITNELINETQEFKGGNTANATIVAKFANCFYLIPPNCNFYNYDVREIKKFIQEKYDVIVMDPPWWNKYIRRKRKRNAPDGYKMMSYKDLGDLPIDKLLKDNGLIAVWCTNSKSHIDTLINEMFPKWNLTYVGQWFWLKITNLGDVVTPFSPENGKQPYERLIFGIGARLRNLPEPKNNTMLISVPSAIHSNKPPLREVLRPFLPNNPTGLEIFARSLLPNWTSFGNEVLKLQNVSLFCKTPSQT